MNSDNVGQAVLYVVATPIGNLDDITLRALKILKGVDFVLSENTSQTQKLLDHFDIQVKQIPYRDENRYKIIPQVLDALNSNNSLALVSDSGTPLISDPGFKLVQEVKKHGVEVIPIPGASAVIAALVKSGLPTDKFTFLGFLPRKENASKDTLIEFGNLDSTLVIYESPHRVLKTLKKIEEVLGNRYVSVVKEITKIYEKDFTGNVSEIIVELADQNFRGEFVILVAKEGFNE